MLSSITGGGVIITGDATTMRACELSDVDGDIAALVVTLRCYGVNVENDLYTNSSGGHEVADFN